MARPRKASVDNTALLEAALEGLELQKSRIEAQIGEVRRMLGKRSGKTAAATSAPPASAAKPRKKRQLSAAARKRIAAAQKKRWAEYRKTTPKQ